MRDVARAIEKLARALVKAETSSLGGIANAIGVGFLGFCLVMVGTGFGALDLLGALCKMINYNDDVHAPWDVFLVMVVLFAVTLIACVYSVTIRDDSGKRAG